MEKILKIECYLINTQPFIFSLLMYIKLFNNSMSLNVEDLFEATTTILSKLSILLKFDKSICLKLLSSSFRNLNILELS